MKSILTILLIILPSLLLGQDHECDEPLFPYWANGIDSKIEGDLPRVRQVYQAITESEKNISPNNGFITLQIHVSAEGEVCDIIIFEIDQNYEPVTFNKGKLTAILREEVSSFNWIRKKPFKTYNLIRFKIENGAITEIF